MKYLYILIFLIYYTVSFAQVESPPSLLLGLSGLTGEKGNIDVALLAEIISEKQGELKKEFIKREFYDGLQAQNYVVWEYAYNSLEVLLNSKNRQAISKEMLEYAANLALVYSFTETYLQVSDKLCNSDLEAVIAAWDTSPAKYKDYFQCGSGGPDIKSKLWLSTLKGSGTTNLSAILIDLVFDVMHTNKTLKDLGFFQSQMPLGQDFYNTHNQYLITTGPLRVALDKLRGRMETEAMVLINYYYVIKMAVNRDISISDFFKSEKFEQVPKEELTTLFADLGKISETIAKSGKPTDTELSTKISKALGAFLDFSSRTEGNTYKAGDVRYGAYTVDDLYYLEEVIFPLIVKLVTEYGLDPRYLTLTQKYRSNILYKLLHDMDGLLSKTAERDPQGSGLAKSGLIKELSATDYSAFVDMLKQIFELDKAGTYEDYIKTLRNVGEIFEDNNVGRMIFNLTDFLEKYTILDREHNAISVDVEEIIVQLLNKYEARINRNCVNFYFSIGLSQTANIHYKKGFELQSDSAVNIRNIAFASEKIGVKVKLMDWRRQRSFDYGEKYNKMGSTIKKYNTRQPLVNDVYWLFYGSGILYNIANTTTGGNFHYPIIGTGIGIAFYNSLDFNIFFSSPLVSSETLGQSLARRQFLGFSFDIKVGEYITALKKKRAEKKDAQ
ncbi:MAG: hypothetical protein ABIS36_05390 [Chryseolinea sp.]